MALCLQLSAKKASILLCDNLQVKNIIDVSAISVLVTVNIVLHLLITYSIIILSISEQIFSD